MIFLAIITTAEREIRQYRFQRGKTLIFTFILFFTVTPRIFADIIVAPVTVFLSDAAKSGAIAIQNISNVDREIQVDIRFGYPLSDTQGNTIFRFLDSSGVSDFSAVGWLSVTPRHFILKPGERQTIRIMARPPSDIPMGEYTSQLVVTSLRAQNSAPTKSVHEGIAGNIATVITSVVSLHYRRGQTTTGIAVRDISAVQEDGKLVLRAFLERNGNSAYIGTIYFTLRNYLNSDVKKWTRPVTVFRSLSPRFEIPVSDIPSGSYTLEIIFETKRKGANSADIIQSESVRLTKTIQL